MKMYLVITTPCLNLRLIIPVNQTLNRIDMRRVKQNQTDQIQITIAKSHKKLPPPVKNFVTS